MRYEDLLGNIYGNLKVISKCKLKSKRIKWKCLCSCGKLTYVYAHKLKSGHTKSCGCLRRQKNTNRFDDLSGKKFNSLTVIKYKYSLNGCRYWLCKCDCGNTTIVSSNKLRYTKSCGCLIFSSNGDSKTKFWNIWYGMKRRCSYVNNSNYHNYGGRGISYDPRWDNYLEFKKDMYFKYVYAKKHKKIKQPSLERIDVNGNYCKENCIFIDILEQADNKCNTVYFMAISPEGKIYKSRNYSKFAKKFNLERRYIHLCLTGLKINHCGWKFKRI